MGLLQQGRCFTVVVMFSAAKWRSRKTEGGFTIIELMIALTVLSTILALGATIITRISFLYTKGVNSAALQNASRNISSDVGSELQFAGIAPAPCNSASLITTCFAGKHTYSGVDVYAFCINKTRYSYVLNRTLGLDQSTDVNTPHVLWRDTMDSSATCDPVDMTQASAPSANGYEMVGSHMRISRFKVEETPVNSNIYAVDVWMAYGDDDLVVVDTSADPAKAGRTTCRGDTGSQFCAISNISTSVTMRIR